MQPALVENLRPSRIRELVSFRVSVVRGLTSSGVDVTQQCPASARPQSPRAARGDRGDAAEPSAARREPSMLRGAELPPPVTSSPAGHKRG